MLFLAKEDAMEKMQEQIRHLYKENERQERRSNNHSERLDVVEQFKASTEIEIRNLIEQIKSLVSIMQWALGLGFATLIGFFIWYVQNV